MQTVSGPVHARKVHFEAPPSSKVPKEMTRFVEWFKRTGPRASNRCRALNRAGVAHLYFESIHPFKDGNGRIGRAIAEKALSQGSGRSGADSPCRDDPDQAQRTKNNDLTRWPAWFAEITLEAQRRTATRIEFLIEGPQGFKGGLSAGNYSTITGASTATSTCDLADLVPKAAIVRTGDRRHARYFVAIPLRPVPPVTSPLLVRAIRSFGAACPIMRGSV